MGLLTILGFGLFFIIGLVVGVAVENNHQEQSLRRKELDYRRWAQGQRTIEDEMISDGWRKI
jgi:hypothetical protein